MRIYDVKLSTPDPPHGFDARFAHVTAEWIKSLDRPDRAKVFEYIGSILQQPGECPQKLRTVMMLAMLPGPETGALMDKMLEEGALMHPPIIMQYVCSNKVLCEKKDAKN